MKHLFLVIFNADFKVSILKEDEGQICLVLSGSIATCDYCLFFLVEILGKDNLISFHSPQQLHLSLLVDGSLSEREVILII